MNWKIVQASVVGTSHASRGELCQDDCIARTFPAPGDNEYFVALVSDGAGSATHGGQGAVVACETGIKVIEESITQVSLPILCLDIILEWVDTIRYHLWLVSKAKGCLPRDFACTILGAVIGEGSAAFFQIGDGAIIIGQDNEFRPVFWPDSGEYANMTYFLTDENALSSLHVTVYPVAPTEIAIFSDGIQRLALVYHTKEAHKPFFEPMFARLRKASSADECDFLSTQLAVFLGSPAINTRTDDDKTLVIATRRPLDN